MRIKFPIIVITIRWLCFMYDCNVKNDTNNFNTTNVVDKWSSGDDMPHVKVYISRTSRPTYRYSMNMANI